MVEEFYDEVYENGVPFKVRKMNTLLDMPTYKKTPEAQGSPEANKLKTNKTYNVQDEILGR